MRTCSQSSSRFAALMLLAPSLALPDDPLAALKENLYERGRAVCNDGKWTEALPLHERLTKLDPDYGFGWMGLGWSRQYSGDFAGAIPAYRRALELGGMPVYRIHRQIAECFVSLENYEDALAELDRAITAGLPGLEKLREHKLFAKLRSHSEFGSKFRALMGDHDVSDMTRNQGWAVDLDLLKREVLRMHHNPLKNMTREQLNQAIEEIKASIGTKTDEQLAVEVMKFMRRLGDGHTWARTKDQAFEMERGIPIVMRQFDDGIFVTGAEHSHRDLVWARVDKIDGHETPEVLAKLDAVVASDNRMGLLSGGPWQMRFPAVLHGLGLCRSPRELKLNVTDHQGRPREVTLSAGDPITTAKLARTPPGVEQAQPIHMKRRREFYWFERIPESRVIYFQYNACQEIEEKPLEAFAAELVDAIENSDVDTLIIDLRWNGGGNLFVSRPLFSRLLPCRKILKPGSLFVIAGRHTFSAAMVFAAQIERYTPAIFVGEPTGSSPNFVGETNLVSLPYTKMTVSISNLAWQNSHAMDTRVWIAPKIRTPMSFEAWKNGRDEAVDTILRLKSSD